MDAAVKGTGPNGAANSAAADADPSVLGDIKFRVACGHGH